VLWFPIGIPAWVFLDGGFLYQFFESNYSLVQPNTGGSGVAFFAHVGGFVFGFLGARVLVGTHRMAARRPGGTRCDDSPSLVGVVVLRDNDGARPVRDDVGDNGLGWVIRRHRAFSDRVRGRPNSGVTKED
jgi:hypothetical protein